MAEAAPGWVNCSPQKGAASRPCLPKHCPSQNRGLHPKVHHQAFHLGVLTQVEPPWRPSSFLMWISAPHTFCLPLKSQFSETERSVCQCQKVCLPLTLFLKYYFNLLFYFLTEKGAVS